MRGVLILILLIIAIYPTWLVWRFLTLAIKCMKKYLRIEYEYVVDDEDDE